MTEKQYKYLYGPVPSWRLGSSLGMDPISAKDKVCSFDCSYCQIGKTTIHTKKRQIFVSTEELLEELKSLPPLDIDYLTFSGRGEPTLAKNLGEMIEEVRKIRREPVAVLTNASLLSDKEVRGDLSKANFVVAKLDASSDSVFKKMNGPVVEINLSKVVEGIKKFSSEYSDKLALQIMFANENEKEAKDIAQLARKIGANEIQLNTPLRPCRVNPLSAETMKEIEKHFEGLNVISVYKSVRKKVKPVSAKDTLKRRGKI